MEIQDTTRKLLLMGLASYANDDGHCWPSQETLAARVGCTDRTVRTHLAAMEEAGWLTRETRSSVGGRYSDLYILTLPPPQPEKFSGCATGNLKHPQPENFSGCTKVHESVMGNRPTPLTPRAPKAPKAKPDALTVPIPPELDTPEFAEAWAMWFKDRKARGKRVTAAAARLQLDRLAREAKDPAVAAEWIYYAIEKGWQGIYRPKDTSNDQKNGRTGIMWTGFDKIDYSAGQIRGNDGRTYV